MRLKVRYFLCELKFADGVVDQAVNSGAIYRTLQFLVEKHYGDMGAGAMQGLNVKYHNPLTGVTIIRCPRAFYRMLYNVIVAVRQVKHRACVFDVIHLGGTMRSCQERVLEHNARALMLADRTRVSRARAQAVADAATLAMNLAQTALPAQGVPAATVHAVASVTGEFVQTFTADAALAIAQGERTAAMDQLT